MAVAEQREKDGVGKSGGRLEGKGRRGWFRERVEAVEQNLKVSRFGSGYFVWACGRCSRPDNGVLYALWLSYSALHCTAFTR
jgi:hypothetical protein